MSGIRQDLVETAVKFLKDEKVSSSPLAKRIAFLESKGLSQTEIEEALTRLRSGDAVVVANSVGGEMKPVEKIVAQSAPPPLPARVIQKVAFPWYNWIYLCILAGGVSTALGHLLQTYPKWIPKSIAKYLGISQKSQIKEGPESVAKAEELNQIKEDLEKLKQSLLECSSNQTEMMGIVRDMQTNIKEISANYQQKLLSLGSPNEELKALKGDLESVQTLIPQVMQQSKEFQGTLIEELKQELSCLRDLALSKKKSTEVQGETNHVETEKTISNLLLPDWQKDIISSTPVVASARTLSPTKEVPEPTIEE